MPHRHQRSESGIGTLGEHHLHAALKEHLQQPGDLVEQEVEGFVVDLVRGAQLIEIQTRGFTKMAKKLDRLLDRHPVRLVHPIAAELWIVKLDDDGAQTSRRKSPRRGQLVDVCAELVSFPTLLSHPNFTLEVVLVQEEEVRRPNPKAWRRRGWSTVERRLLDVVGSHTFESTAHLGSLLPSDLPDPWGTAELAKALGRSRRLAQQVAYCLREAGIASPLRRTRRGHLYTSAPSGPESCAEA